MGRRQLAWLVLIVAAGTTAGALAVVSGRRPVAPRNSPGPEHAVLDEPGLPEPVREAIVPESTPVSTHLEAAAPEFAKQDPLPDCFYGDIKVHGLVKDESGTPMAGMRVECVPCTIDPATPERLARFTCRSGDGGVFVLESLPEASRYAFRASGPGAYGEATHPLEDVRGAVIGIVVSSAVSYERYDFFEQDGAPVDVRGRVAFGSGDVIWTSALGLSPETAARLAATGLPVEDLPANAAMAVFHRSGATRRLGPGGEATMQHAVRIAGYAETRIDPVRIRPGEWPRSIRVTLRADGSPPQIAHRVVFPPAPSPLPGDVGPYVEAAWQRMCVRVRVGEAAGEMSVSRFRPFFWAPRDAVLRFHLESADVDLPGRVRYDDAIATVTLEPPALAVPFLRYDPGAVPWARVQDQEQVHFQLERRDAVVRGRMGQPGLVFFGAVSPGDATVRCVWPEGRSFAWSAKGPLPLPAGVREVRWE